MLYTVTCTCIINCIDLPNILLRFSVSTRWGMNMMMMEKAVKGLHNFFFLQYNGDKNTVMIA